MFDDRYNVLDMLSLEKSLFERHFPAVLFLPVGIAVAQDNSVTKRSLLMIQI